MMRMSCFRIRAEGKPLGAHVSKRRTHLLFAPSQEAAEKVADDLRKYHGLKILWVKEG